MNVESYQPLKRDDAALDPAAVAASAVYAPVLCLVEYDITEPEQSFVTGYRGVQLGAVDVFRYEGTGLHRGDRMQSHILADCIDDYLVSIPLRARIDFHQGEQRNSIEPGQFALLSTSRPFTASVSNLDKGEIFSALHVRISGASLRQRMPHVDEYCGQLIRLRPGAGIIMQQMCELAIFEGQGLSINEAPRFASMLLDAVINATDHSPEVSALPIMSSNWTHLRICRQAKAYIENHLSDPELDTEAVAAHCHVSKRYLQAAFADCGETVGSTIREMRLQRCHEALLNPSLRKLSIGQIATHWGFVDLPHFCRSYKARFDRPPSKDREASAPH